MTKRISELPATGGVADTDELELNQGGVSRKATRGQLIAGLASAAHQHALADIADAGTLAALDSIDTAEINGAAYATQVEAVAGADNAKLMTSLRTAEAIAAQAAAPVHQHPLAEVTDAGTLAGLDQVGTAEIAAAAYASQGDAVAGANETRIMTALRTAEAIAARAAPPGHQHDVADITDAGALAALDKVGAAEIDFAAYATQTEALAGTDNAKIMTALRTAEAIAAQAVAPEHQHELADITDVGALAALDAVRLTEIDSSVYATQIDAVEGIDGTRFMTAERTAEAIAAQAAPQEHQHSIADVTDAGTLAALDLVGAGEIAPNAITSGKILSGAVINAKLGNGAVTTEKILDEAVSASKIAGSAVITSKLANAAVTPEKIADGAVGASKLQPGIPINMQDAVLTAPELRDYAESSPAPVVNSGALTLDLETGNVFEVVLTEDVISLILAHPPASGRAGSCSIILRQDATGGRTLTWPSSVKWAGGAPPPITSAANAVDVYALITRDGGETWFGFPGGQDFS